MDFQHQEGSNPEQQAPRKHQPLADIIEEIDRLVPFDYMKDFGPPPSYPGYSLGEIATRSQICLPSSIRIGEWFYPRTASLWSVFRGLATSTQIKAMLAATETAAPSQKPTRAHKRG